MRSSQKWMRSSRVCWWDLVELGMKSRRVMLMRSTWLCGWDLAYSLRKLCKEKPNLGDDELDPSTHNLVWVLHQVNHRLNMELDLKSLFGLLCTLCTHWLRPRNSPPPPYLGSYTRALLVSQDRQHLFVTPWGLHRKKRFTSFPSPAGMPLTKLPLGRNNSVMTSLFPPRESLVVTSRLGMGNSRTFFLRCTHQVRCICARGRAGRVWQPGTQPGTRTKRSASLPSWTGSSLPSFPRTFIS